MIRALRVLRPALLMVTALAGLMGCARPETYKTLPAEAVSTPFEPNVSLTSVPEESARKVPPTPRPRPVLAIEPGQSPDKPKIDWLVGQDFASVQALLGDPALKEVQAPANVWAYNGSGCVLNIFFYPHVGGSGYQALTYEVRGPEQTADVEAHCFDELLDEKNRAKAN